LEAESVFDLEEREARLRCKFAATAVFALMVATSGSAQDANFTIVWSTLGEVAASAQQSARTGRQLFTAAELADLSLKKITVARVEVEPTIVTLRPGEGFCLSTLQVRATTEQRTPVDGAPLSVSVRQDHRPALGIRRSKNDICFAPTAAGEYPVRLQSLLPARDGTLRGAQMFLRVGGNDSDVSRAGN
jgi:hypothetical protein